MAVTLTSFAWTISGRLAGSGLPGLMAPLDEDMRFIRGQGIRRIVTLTEAALAPEAKGYGIPIIHFPVSDMGISTPRAVYALCRRALTWMSRDEPVLVHCRAGLGRTGTVLACVLVSLGEEPAQALRRVRALKAMYVQTEAQAMFIHHYAAFVASLPHAPDASPGALR